MRSLLLAILIALLSSLSACRTQKPIVVSDPAFDYSKTFLTPAPLTKGFSDITYPVEIVGYGADGKHVKIIQAAPNYALAACGGALLGRDAGEWGGELVFRGKGGTIQRMLEKNVHGIFRMPFGIVVFTGLAHLGINEGSIYLVSCRPAGASASLMRNLPGAPDDAFRTTENDLVFRVMTNRFREQDRVSMPVKDCYLLEKSEAIEEVPCSSITKAGNGST